MPNWKKARPKVRGKKDVVDEWEITDIDRNEQKLGIERRKRRWRDIEKAALVEKAAEDVAIKNAEKMGKVRDANLIELAWLRCDYVLSNIMQNPAYNMMEYFRTTQPETYKTLYKIFISRYMMKNIQYFVDYFTNGGIIEKKITLADVYKYYKKIYGLKNKITIKRKGKDDKTV